MANSVGDWFQAQAERLSRLTGRGLVGKTSGVFLVFGLVCLAAVWQLPDELKIHALYVALIGLVLFGALFVLAARDPVMANMDDENAWKYVKALAAMNAKNPGTISGSAKPISNPMSKSSEELQAIGEAREE